MLKWNFEYLPTCVNTWQITLRLECLKVVRVPSARLRRIKILTTLARTIS